MTTLKQQLAAVTHDNILIDTSMSARRAQLKILEDIITALAPRVKDLRSQVTSLQQRLSTLLGDSILAAALVAFGGMLSWPQKLAAVKRWTASMCKHKLPHTPEFSLVEMMDFLDQRHVALPRSVILSESLRHNLYSVSLVWFFPNALHVIALSFWHVMGTIVYDCPRSSMPVQAPS
jgi:hypothetical protein